MAFGRSRATCFAIAVLWTGGGGLLRADDTEIAGFKATASGPVLVTQPRLQPEWGTQDRGVRTVHGLAFQESDSSTTFSFDSGTTHRFRTGGPVWFDAALPDLPAGALITTLELEACDTSAVAGVSAFLFQRLSPSGPHAEFGTVNTGNPETSGCDFFGVNLVPVDHRVDNFNRTYWIRVALGAADNTTSLGAVRVYYQLQVSAAPPAASFGDVPTSHAFFRFIEALAASGITAGCGSGNFCPDSPLTRGQMAVFLSIALGLHFPY